MKRKDLHDGMRVVLNDGRKTEAYIIQNGGWTAIKETRNNQLPSFKVPATIFENRFSNDPKYFATAEGFPHVAIAVLTVFPAYRHAGVTYPEETFWIPDVVAPEKILCTWKKHLENLELEKKQEEQRKREEEERKLKEQEKGAFRAALSKKLRDLGLRRIEMPGRTYDDYQDTTITEEDDVILDMYELAALLDKMVTWKSLV